MKVTKILGLVLLLASPLLSQPPGPPISPSGGSADPLTVLGPADVCADQQIALWNGASNTSLQCSVLTVADTTGNLTGPSGGFTIFGGTAATDDLILDGSAGTAGVTTITEAGDVLLNSGYFRTTSSNGFIVDGDSVLGSSVAVYIGRYPGGVEQFSGLISFYGATNIYGGPSAGVLEQRYLTTQNTFRIYNTAFTDAYPTVTNYERLTLTGVAGTSVDIKAETAGTGADDLDIVLTPAGAGLVISPGQLRAYGIIADITPLNGGDADGLITAGQVNVGGDVALGIYGSTAAAVEFRGTSDSSETRLLATNPTADRTITLPDATGTVLLNVRVVTPDIDGETTTAVQSGTLWTNTGDGDGEAITLLNDPGIGANYCFAADVAQTITVAPSTGETLYYGTDQCVASLTSNAIGSTLCVTAITGGSGAKWFTMSHEGSWTCND